MHARARDRAIPLVAVLFPQRYQVSQRDWDAAVTEYSLDPQAFDLDGPNRRILAYCEKQVIPCLDLLPSLRQANGIFGDRLYMALGDMHWNARGHKVAGEAIATYIRDHFLKSDSLSFAKMRDAAEAIERAVIEVISTKLKSLSAGRMGYNTGQVGDMIADRVGH